MADTDIDLVEATGLAISLVGALLEAQQILPKGEFGRHLGNLAVVTAKTEPVQGDILGRWAALATQIGRGLGP